MKRTRFFNKMVQYLDFFRFFPVIAKGFFLSSITFLRRFSMFFLCAFIVLIFVFSIRGIFGNPSAEELNQISWRDHGPLELSPERGRFALLYSVAENHSLHFSLPLARFVVPDLALNSKGEYVSLFAPAVSFFVLPGYFLGKFFGVSQVGAYSIIALFALVNIFLVYLISIRCGAKAFSGWLAGFSFAFATPAFAYGVNLYQHHISTFLILMSLYALFSWKGWRALAIIWFLCGLSIVVDNPNFFLMLPIGIFALGKIVSFRFFHSSFSVSLNPRLLLTGFAIVVPIVFFLWFNLVSNGDPFKLSGSLVSVPAINERGMPTNSRVAEISGVSDWDVKNEKTAVGFFKTRNLLNGFYIHVMSPDRGIVRFAPIILFGIFGLVLLSRKDKKMFGLFSAIILVNLILYSMWGDPWGGWAFGSRYLIPAYAILAIGLSLVFESWKKNIFAMIFLFGVFFYSVSVNALGAVTTSMNPPQVQVLSLEKISGKEQKYSFDRNWQYLHQAGSKSFVYQTWASRYMSAETYYFLLVAFIVSGSGILFVSLIREGISEKRRV